MTTTVKELELEEEIDRLQMKVESLEEELNNVDIDLNHFTDRETDLEMQRDKLQGDLGEAQEIINWVKEAYPQIMVEYNAVMDIQGK
jgi:chromosome segregation ATPase